MALGAPNRGQELTRILAPEFFTVKDSAVISSRAGAIRDVYPSLTRAARQVLLHPNIFPVFLGTKDAYIQYTGEPDTEQLSHEICAFPRIAQNFGLLFTDTYTVNIHSFKQRLDREGSYLSEKQCLSADEAEFLRNRPVDRDWVNRLFPMLARHIQPGAERTYFQGFLMGYPIQDIEYVRRMEHSGALPYATVIVEYFGNNMLSDEDHTSFFLLKRWESAMRFGYGLLSHFPHFWDDLDVGLSNSLSTIVNHLGSFTEMTVDVKVWEEHQGKN